MSFTNFNNNEIEIMAVNYFRNCMQAGWLTREQHPDVHIDFFVEISENSEPTGVNFGVQIKGKSKPRYDNNYIKLNMKTKHLKYWVDNVRSPMFLVVVDVSQQSGYWIFIQRWLKESIQDPNWRDKTKKTITVPLKNKLSDTYKLKEAVLEADKYMRELWPSSIESAVQQEEDTLNRLDNRIKTSINYYEGNKLINLLPNNLSVSLPTLNLYTNVKTKISQLINEGKPITLYHDEFSFNTDSDLIRHLLNISDNGTLHIEPHPVNNLMASINIVNEQCTSTPIL